MKKRIYLDYAATTPVRKEVKKAMEKFWDIDFGNAGAFHTEGTTAQKSLNESRKKIASIIHAQPEELIFTSGGTESNNLAILGVLNKLKEAGKKTNEIHLITTVFEHPSVLQCFKYFEQQGAQVDYLNINQEGIIDLNQLKRVITEKTVLISIMFVNNEIGTIQPISEVVKIIQDFKKKKKKSFTNFPIFHSDFAQALLYLPINTQKLNIDLISFDAQKIYGPKGVGALYVKKGTEISPLIMGGKQEGGLRPGTENIPLISGFAKALELAEREKNTETKRLVKLRDYFIKEITKKIPGTILNGSLDKRLPNNINISFPNKNNEFLVVQLDQKGVACSTKSACSKEKDSYVIQSLGKESSRTQGAVRFTLGRTTTKKEIDLVIKSLLEIFI